MIQGLLRPVLCLFLVLCFRVTISFSLDIMWKDPEPGASACFLCVALTARIHEAQEHFSAADLISPFAVCSFVAWVLKCCSGGLGPLRSRHHRLCDDHLKKTNKVSTSTMAATPQQLRHVITVVFQIKVAPSCTEHIFSLSLHFSDTKYCLRNRVKSSER